MHDNKDDQVIVTAELTVRGEAIDAFLTYAMNSLDSCRSQPGNLAFDVLIEQARPETVTFLEIWATIDDQRRYMAWRTERGDFAHLLSFLASPPTLRVLRRMGSHDNSRREGAIADAKKSPIS